MAASALGHLVVDVVDTCAAMAVPAGIINIMADRFSLLGSFFPPPCSRTMSHKMPNTGSFLIVCDMLAVSVVGIPSLFTGMALR